MDLDQWVDDALGPIAERLAAVVFFALEIGGARVPLIVLWLIAAGLFCSPFWARSRLRLSGAIECHSMKTAWSA